jgi:HemY protein
MRAAIWLMGLFAVAVACALFAASDPGTVTLYWPPYRVDLSLNLVLLTLLLFFVVLHLALRTASAMFSIPQKARTWRLQQKERAIYAALLESLAHLVGGRFIRARKAAELVVSLEDSMQRNGEALPHAGPLRALSHLLAAESAHALQDRAVRDAHLEAALQQTLSREAGEIRDGVQLRGARWAFDDRDAAKSLDWLDQLSSGAARRTLALRLRFKAARLSGNVLQALELARLLTKHRAFSETAGKSIARGLAIEYLNSSHDEVQIQNAWEQLDAAERMNPDVAMQAAERLLSLGGQSALSRQWLLPVWDLMLNQGATFALSQKVRLVRILEAGFGAESEAPDSQWLSRIEAAQMSNPRDAVLQYLAGIVCVRLSLWGKAQQLLKQSMSMLQDPALKRDAWCALGLIAEQRRDTEAATHAYRQALAEAAKL